MNKNETKRYNQRNDVNNPCSNEHKLSLKCLNDNNYDSDRCEIPFENYNVCKAFWNEVRLDRMRRGIEPYIPPLEERSEILKEKFKGKKFI